MLVEVVIMVVSRVMPRESPRSVYDVRESVPEKVELHARPLDTWCS